MKRTVCTVISNILNKIRSCVINGGKDENQKNKQEG